MVLWAGMPTACRSTTGYRRLLRRLTPDGLNLNQGAESSFVSAGGRNLRAPGLLEFALRNRRFRGRHRAGGPGFSHAVAGSSFLISSETYP